LFCKLSLFFQSQVKIFHTSSKNPHISVTTFQPDLSFQGIASFIAFDSQTCVICSQALLITFHKLSTFQGIIFFTVSDCKTCVTCSQVLFITFHKLPTFVDIVSLTTSGTFQAISS